MEEGESERERERERERESRSTCATPGERLRQSLRKQTKYEVARRGPEGKRIAKKSLQGLLRGRETPDFFFLTAHEHDESWRCVHVDVREVGEVGHNCGFAYAGQGQIMNLSQISGHDIDMQVTSSIFLFYLLLHQSHAV